MANNPLFNLTTQRVSDSFGNILQTDGQGNFYNGLGDEVAVTGSGAQGAEGIQGPAGSQGIEGAQGNQGPVGQQGTQGNQGFQGRQGPEGKFGGEAFDYHYDSSTSVYTGNGGEEDHGNQGTMIDGQIQFNRTSLNLATKMYIDFHDDNGISLYNYLQTIDDSTSAIKGHFKITDKNNLENYAMFAIIGNHSNNSSYFQVPISFLSGMTTLTDGLDILITFARSGDTGDTGAQGATGQQGRQGATGQQGRQGPQGFQGNDSTVAGPQGRQGATGTQGRQGPNGVDGNDSTVAGPQGTQGRQGTTGQQGRQGPSGVDGTDSNVAGPQGPQGPSVTGAQGRQGPNGTQGSQGPAGGPQGTQGRQGPAGADSTVAGPQGAQGSGSNNTSLVLKPGVGSGTTTFDYNTGSIFYLTGITAAGTWNITNVPTTASQKYSVNFVVDQGSTARIASAYQVNSSSVTIQWENKTTPSGTANNFDEIHLDIYRIGTTWVVLGKLTTFGTPSGGGN